MDPKRFGPFLARARREKGLTQAQLAKILSVTNGAVSKWERCLCLPDVSKLADIAQALDLNILEVLKAERLPAEADGPEISVREEQVYSATLDTARRQSRRTWRGRLIKLAAVVAVFLFFCFHPFWHIIKVWAPGYYTTSEVSQLAYIGSREDRQTARQVIATAEEAFSSVGISEEEAEERFGILKRYTMRHPDAVSERHDLRLWSSRFYSNDGTMWVYFNHEGMDSGGNVVSGSWDVLSLWFLKRSPSGQWEVVYIKEHP